jgi:type IV pilus assembly protein PilY1
VSLNPSFPRVAGTLVLFGTGELLTVGDLSSSQVQTLYGVLDPFTLKTYARSNLTGQTLSVSSTTATTGQAFITVSNTSVNLSTSDGWYADLSGLGTGMRDITNPRLESGGVDIVTTFQPSANQCTGGGNGDFLALNYATGGSFAVPVFAIPGSTSPGSTKLSSGNAVGLQFKGDYLSSATIQMTPGGSYKYITSTQLSNSLISNIPIYDDQ